MMKSLAIALLAIALACAMQAAPAQAQAARTFVSAAGSDSNNCLNVTTPCRHFATAFAATAANGEIYVLDPANYGSLTITHAVSIQGHGWGSVAPPASGNAITINATSSDDINLDGLTIDGAGLLGTSGIVFHSGRSLTVDNCIVRKLTGDGLDFFSSSSSTQTLTVSNSSFNDAGDVGLLIETKSTGAITAAIDRTTFSRNESVGLAVQGAFGTGAISVAVTDSVAANGDVGFAVQSNTGFSVSSLSLTHALAAGNQTGVVASGAPATLWLAQSTLTGNATGFDINSGGTINSYGDNFLAAANGAPAGSLSSATKQ